MWRCLRCVLKFPCAKNGQYKFVLMHTVLCVNVHILMNHICRPPSVRYDGATVASVRFFLSSAKRFFLYCLSSFDIWTLTETLALAFFLFNIGETRHRHSRRFVGKRAHLIDISWVMRIFTPQIAHVVPNIGQHNESKVHTNANGWFIDCVVSTTKVFGKYYNSDTSSVRNDDAVRQSRVLFLSAANCAGHSLFMQSHMATKCK